MKKSFKIIAVVLACVLVVSAFAGCSLLNKVIPQSKQLVAEWKDTSSLNSGYKFNDDGTVKITYANFTIPIINQVFNGTIDGIYTTTKEDGKNYVTLSYTVLLTSIEKKYEFSISDNILTLTDPDNGNQTMLQKVEAEG